MTAYVGFFAIGLGPVFWLLIAEIFPLAIRGRAMGVASLTIWVFTIISALILFQLLQSLGQSATFGGCAILTVIGWFLSFAACRRQRDLRSSRLNSTGSRSGLLVGWKA
jgi:MFS transporter, SP family, galactose:H+ symporter